ncbi:MAG: dTMP kinase [Thermodesulfobacteriota bacterium]
MFRKFITLEGIEGSGKTSQIRMLASHLENSGIQVRMSREPGGTAIGDAVRPILLCWENTGMAPLTELFLIAACRAQHVEEVLLPSLEMGKVVLCDRFTDATLAYQGYGRGLELEMVRQVNALAAHGLVPGLTVLLDCPVEVGLERSRKRLSLEGKTWSEGRFEAEERSFHQRVREGYLELARQEPGRFRVIDAGRSPGEVASDVLQQVMEHLGL